MENFFYDDKYFPDLDALTDYIEEDEIKEWADDHVIECYKSELQPIVKLSPEWICKSINEERWPEDEEQNWYEIKKILSENIDFDKINTLIPELYYETREKFTITKKELLEVLK